MAKAFLMPTRTLDTFPRTVLESMSKGTPVMGFANGAISEMIGENGGSIISSCQDFEKALRNEYNHDKVFDYSKKFHINEEVKTLLRESFNF
jgi:glycosyltransferase involved in cell wall biosynthesis